MAKARRTRTFAVKKMLKPTDDRIKHPPAQNPALVQTKKATAKAGEKSLIRAPQTSSALFFRHNEQLGPPYHVLLDTNFINFSITNKLEIVTCLMDCLLAKAIPSITDCVMAELEKLGPKYRMALAVAKDPRFVRLPCDHKGTYADDCLVRRVTMHRCYLVATCDRDLRRRLRKVPGVPIMYITQHKYSVERMPEAWGAPRNG